MQSLDESRCFLLRRCVGHGAHVEHSHSCQLFALCAQRVADVLILWCVLSIGLHVNEYG
jgi:hypothetical protein